MATLDEINEQINELENSYRKLWLEESLRKQAVKEISEQMELLEEEKSELMQKKKLLELSEITQAEKDYVYEQLSILEGYLSQPSVREINIHVADPNYESKLLTIRITTDFLKEGVNHSVNIWSNRSLVIDLVRSSIHIPVFSEVIDDKELTNIYKNDYRWTKKEYPDIQMFKL